MAAGYDVTARALPFYQHINTSVSVEQYFGDSVDLFTPAPATIIRWPSPLGSLHPGPAGHGDR